MAVIAGSARRKPSPWEPIAVDLQEGRREISVPLPNTHDEWVIALHDGDGVVLSSMAYGGSRLLDRAQPEKALIQVLSHNDQALNADASLDELLPGDRIRLRVVAPFAGKLLLSVEQDRVNWWRQIAMEGPETEVELIVGDDWGPNALLTAEIIRGLDRTPRGEASRAQAALPLRLSRIPLRLHGHIVHADEVTPGSNFPLRIKVEDHLGKAVPGRGWRWPSSTRAGCDWMITAAQTLSPGLPGIAATGCNISIPGCAYYRNYPPARTR